MAEESGPQLDQEVLDPTGTFPHDCLEGTLTLKLMGGGKIVEMSVLERAIEQWFPFRVRREVFQYCPACGMNLQT